MLNAVQRKFPQSARQRCVKHKMDNVFSYVPDKQRDQVEPELKAIFYQDNRAQADQAVVAFCEKYAKTYPTAVECFKRDNEGSCLLMFFAFVRWLKFRCISMPAK